MSHEHFTETETHIFPQKYLCKIIKKVEFINSTSQVI